MFIVELNVAGYRFCREVPDLRRKSLRPIRLSPRNGHWRIPQLRQSNVA